MKKIVLLLSLLTISIGIYAQSPADLELQSSQRAQKMTQHLQFSCKLSDEQASKVEAINKSALDKIYQARANHSKSKEDMGKLMKSVQEERIAAIHGVLSPEQAACYDNMKAEQKKHAEENKGHMRSQAEGFDF